MPAKPLTPEQKADAARLMKLFRQKVADEKHGKRLTQATLADAHWLQGELIVALITL